jgi:hypothetical protein
VLSLSEEEEEAKLAQEEMDNSAAAPFIDINDEIRAV